MTNPLINDNEMSAADAATQLRVTPTRIRQLINARELRGRKIAGLWFVRRGDVEQLAKERAEKAR